MLGNAGARYFWEEPTNCMLQPFHEGDMSGGFKLKCIQLKANNELWCIVSLEIWTMVMDDDDGLFFYSYVNNKKPWDVFCSNKRRRLCRFENETSNLCEPICCIPKQSNTLRSYQWLLIYI